MHSRQSRSNLFGFLAIPALLFGCQMNADENGRGADFRVPPAQVEAQPAAARAARGEVAGDIAPAAGQTPRQITREEYQELAPGLGYLKARNTLREPQDLLGGPVTVRVRNTGQEARVILPGPRELDMRVFGAPGLPRSFAGTPGVNGVPLEWRQVQGGRYTSTTRPVAASDKWVAASDGSFILEAVDQTATDAAVTNDKVRFEASWKDDQGNTYTVRCNNVVPHGVEYPVFGGVVTNHLMHGFTRIGTALMPTEFAYVAFWGMGETLKNGQVMEKPIIVHGMLTEKVRVNDYQLAHDEQVIPTQRHFHLMVPPVMPVKGKMEYQHDPVDTGWMMPDGKPLPFWHVMFEDVEYAAERAGAEPQPAAERLMPQDQQVE